MPVSISDDKTKTHMTTTDRTQIQTAIDTVLNKESYLALMPDDFKLISPNQLVFSMCLQRNEYGEQQAKQ